MEHYLYNSYKSFFNALSKLGYVKDKDVHSLLIMSFIHRLIYEDYRGIIQESDYNIIEGAINCLYGRSCLLPYRDYLKMGKLHLGEYTELAHKLCNLKTYAEDIDDRLHQNDEITASNTTRITAVENRTSSLENRTNRLENKTDTLESNASLLKNRVTKVESRTTSLEERTSSLENRSDAIENETFALSGRVTKVENKATALEGRTTSLESRTTSLEGRTGTLENKAESLEDITTKNSNKIKSLVDIANEYTPRVVELEKRADKVDTWISNEGVKDKEINNRLDTLEESAETLQIQTKSNTNKIKAIENTRVMQNKQTVIEVEDIQF